MELTTFQTLSFYELMDAIRQTPGMYLGRPSLVALRHWLIGFDAGRLHAGAAKMPEAAEFEDFDAFVCDKYDWHDVGGWAAKIAYNVRDDSNAFDEFFKLLDEFRASKEGH